MSKSVSLKALALYLYTLSPSLSPRHLIHHDLTADLFQVYSKPLPNFPLLIPAWSLLSASLLDCLSLDTGTREASLQI